MRSYSLTLANETWESLHTLIEAKAASDGITCNKYMWAVFLPKNTGATTITFVQANDKETAPTNVSGLTLGAGEGVGVDIGTRGEPINGENIWVYSASGAGACDVTVIPIAM